MSYLITPPLGGNYTIEARPSLVAIASSRTHALGGGGGGGGRDNDCDARLFLEACILPI